MTLNLAEHIAHFQRRVLQDALTETLAAYWLRRAQAFEHAAPRLDEFHGKAAPDELNQQWLDCKATAQACRNHAQLIEDGLLQDGLAAEVEEAF